MDNDSGVVRHYEELIRSRGLSAPTPLIPNDHRVNWSDAPSKFGIYLDSARVPLSVGLNRKRLRLGEHEEESPTSNRRTVSTEDLSDFLLLTTGLLRRKLVVNWGIEGAKSATTRSTTYSRGAASGGGLYPVGAYLVLRDQLGLPGAYYYDVAHHGVTRLRLGNFESVIAAALDFQDEHPSDFWIILTVRFWRNAFKYHNFGYQVVTQDIGASIGTMEQVAHSLGWKTTVIYWFRDKLLSSLLGVNVANEAPFAVLAVKKNALRDSRKAVLPESGTNGTFRDLPPIRRRMYERSRNTLLPEMFSQVHEHTLLEKVERPILEPSVWPLGTTSVPQESIAGDLCSLLAHRETGWGRFRCEPPLDDSVLKQVLGFVADGVHYSSDLYGCRVALPTLRISVIAQSVANLPRGVYDYRFSDSQLSLRKSRAHETSLQSVYFLTNHNVDQVSAVLVVVGRIDPVLKTFGGRGIRVMNAETGMAAQRAYIAAAAFSLGCGAVLGFDSYQIGRLLDLDDTLEIPLLLIFIGHQSQAAAAYDFALC